MLCLSWKRSTVQIVYPLPQCELAKSENFHISIIWEVIWSLKLPSSRETSRFPHFHVEKKLHDRCPDAKVSPRDRRDRLCRASRECSTGDFPMKHTNFSFSFLLSSFLSFALFSGDRLAIAETDSRSESRFEFRKTSRLTDRWKRTQVWKMCNGVCYYGDPVTSHAQHTQAGNFASSKSFATSAIVTLLRRST